MKNILKLCLLLTIISCTKKEKISKKYVKDVHSYAKPNQAIAKHLDLDIKVNFKTKKIKGVATYTIQTNANEIHFDSKALKISKVTLDGLDKKTLFKLIKGDEIHGDDLKIAITKETKTVSIFYETTNKTEALQFLNPQQTTDKKEPFLFTQGEAILTRTWIPIQDSPQIRITYNAKVKVPKNLMAVMSAKNPQSKSKDGIYTFEMKQPISSYLIALAVGDIGYKKISNRAGVYAEKSLLDKAYFEFEDVEKMIVAAENLYGNYRWKQYDIIVLPPSFPFGGMENPRLTFATPTVLAGDKSLTSLVAHELAHSWSGNLVTNATWDDFWLNEGFTVYFERRIMEAVYGKDYANMLAMIGRQDLKEELNLLKDSPNDTKLKLDLNGRNPDDGMTDIAYEKGFLFLKTLEAKVGREKMDAFLKEYFKSHAFSTISTQKFVAYLNKNLLEPNKIKFNVNEWIYQPGIPTNQIKITSTKFTEVMNVINRWKNNKITAKEICNQDWNIQQKIHFIRNIPTKIDNKQLKQLDDACNYTNSTNSYIGMVWFEQTIKHNYHENNVDTKINTFLNRVGRRWYVTTIYRAMIKNNQKDKALEIYKNARKNYHSVTVGTMDEMLDYK